MLSYLTIFSASLCGYALMPAWTIAAATLALTSLSYEEHYRLYRRAGELGLFRQIDATLLSSLFTALCGTAAAYGFGLVVRLISPV